MRQVWWLDFSKAKVGQENRPDDSDKKGSKLSRKDLKPESRRRVGLKDTDSSGEDCVGREEKEGEA